jgi:hypothetical protein
LKRVLLRRSSGETAHATQRARFFVSLFVAHTKKPSKFRQYTKLKKLLARYGARIKQKAKRKRNRNAKRQKAEREI